MDKEVQEIVHVCPLCGWVFKGGEKWKEHMLYKHGLHFSKWHLEVAHKEGWMSEEAYKKFKELEAKHRRMLG